MYISEFACGVIVGMAVEFVVLLALAIWMKKK